VEQQRLNAELTARFTRLVREVEPKGVTISVGAEIGEVGAHNTTPDELRAFMATYPKALAAPGGGAGITKVSVNSGTLPWWKSAARRDARQGAGCLRHGWPRSRGSAGRNSACRRRAARRLDATHGLLREVPGERHGGDPPGRSASTNLIFDHPKLPQAVKDEIRAYCFTHHANERKPDQTEAQFIYTTRKKAWAGMKQRFWDLPADIQDTLMGSLEGMFRDMFERMRVGATNDLVAKFTQAPVVPVAAPPDLADALAR